MCTRPGCFRQRLASTALAPLLRRASCTRRVTSTWQLPPTPRLTVLRRRQASTVPAGNTFPAAPPALAVAHGSTSAAAAASRKSSGLPASSHGAQPEAQQESRGVTLEQLQQAMAHVLGSQYPLERKVTAAELRDLPSLPIIRAKLAALRDKLGAAAAAKLLSSSPRLFSTTAPSAIRHRIGVVAAACGCDFEAALALCTRHKGAAQFLEHKAERIELKLATLRECLGLTAPEELLKALRKSGRILNFAPEVVRGRHAALGSVLRLDGGALVRLLRREPKLLLLAPGKVQAGVEAVREGLELGSWEEAVQVASRSPGLLTRETHHIKAAITWLQRLGLPSTQLARCMILLTASAAQLEEALQELPRTLGIPADEVLLLVRAYPQVLLAPASTARAAWAEVRRAAGLRPEWQAQLLAGSVPSLACFFGASAKRLRDRIQRVADLDPPTERLPALSSILKATPDAFEQLLQNVQAGTFKAGQTRPPPRHASVAAVLPSLAAEM